MNNIKNITVLGEITEARTENTKTYAMSDGSLQTEIMLNNAENTNSGIMTLSAEAEAALGITTYSWAGGKMSSDSEHTIGTSGSESITANRMYLKLTVPTLPRNPRIKSARLELTQKSADFANTQAMGLYKVSTEITEGSCTPGLSSYPIDYDMMASTEEGVVKYSFDITSTVDGIYNNSTAGASLALKLIDETVASAENIVLYGAGSGHLPKLIINYEPSYGVDTSYRTHSHDIGSFGTGSVDLACGNLAFDSTDFAWAGNRKPVTLKRIYNSVLSDKQYTADSSIMLNTADFSAMKLGCGWRLNYMQSLVGASFYHEGELVNGYIYTNEDGEEIRLTEKSGVYTDVDESMTYTADKRSLSVEDDEYIFDEAGRLVTITDSYENVINITYADNRITKITDGIGRAFCFIYNDSGYLTSVTSPDETSITYSYSGDYLSSVTYPDGSNTDITYSGDKPRSVIIKDADGNIKFRLLYTFANGRLYKITEQGYENGAYVSGTSTSYIYTAASNKTVASVTEPADTDEGETDNSSVNTVYTFNDEGEIISEYIYSSVIDNIGTHSGDEVITPLSGYGSEPIYNITNLLINHDCRSCDSWNRMENDPEDHIFSVYANNSSLKYGKYAFVLTSNQEAGIAHGIYQSTSALAAGEYTFSVYANIKSAFTGETAPGAYIRVRDTSGNILAESEHISITDGYLRLTASFTLNSAQAIRAEILTNGAGNVNINAPQLEANPCACDYNYIENGGFENALTGWTVNNANVVSVTANDKFNMTSSLCIESKPSAQRYAYQDVYVKPVNHIRETLMLSGWAKGFALPERERNTENAPVFRLCANIIYNDDTEEKHYADFFPCTDEWQYASAEFSKSEYKGIKNIRVSCEYSYNTSIAYFDNIQLVRRSHESNLDVSDFISVSESGDEETESVTEEESTGSAAPEFEELTDTFGNTLTETSFTDGEFGTVYRSMVYDDKGNDLICETDSRGYITRYTVDPATSRNTEIRDRAGNKTAYMYDAQGKVSKVISKDSNGTEFSNVSYTYDCFGNMTEIVRGDGMKYLLAYNSFHNLDCIGIEGKSEKLISYNYKNGNGRLKEMSYANGDKMKATYNALGQMCAESWYNAAGDITARYKYVYDSKGNIVKTIDILGLREYTYLYEADRLERAVEFDITLDANEIITAKSVVNTIFYTYDSDDNITHKDIVFADGSKERVYYEHREDAEPVVKFTVPDQRDLEPCLPIVSHSKSDSFGRKVFDELQHGAGATSRSFTYHAGEVTAAHAEADKFRSVPTTELVREIVISSTRAVGSSERILSYEYDGEERITKVTDSLLGTTEYTYDALGQLLTETFTDLSGVSTVISSMTYDNYGNILTKNGKTYTYDSTWRDLLTSYNGQSITYDVQGNPTAYLGHNLSWEKGRQLKSFDNISYTYNASGIRTSKTVNGVRHDYVLDGAKILREAWGENVLVPLYDNEDSVCGIKLNDVSYFFVKDLRGDVISIINIWGDTVVRYTYDAWGKCTVKDISDADIYAPANLGEINPFRYRSYYYDEETELYYLQSRYYDPDTGRFVNGDAIEWLGTDAKIIETNIYAYCKNDCTNGNDEFGYGCIESLLNALKSCIDIVTSIIEGLSNSYNKEKKSLENSVKLLTKREKRTLANIKAMKREADKLGKRLGWIGYFIIFITLAIKFSNSFKTGGEINPSILETAIYAFISGIEIAAGKLFSKIAKFVPYIGWLIGLIAGWLLSYLLGKFFTNKKMKRIKSKFSSYIKNKKISLLIWVGYAIKSLTA